MTNKIMPLDEKNKCMFNGNILPINVYTEDDIKTAVQNLRKILFEESFKRGLPLDNGTLDHLPLKFIEDTIIKIFGKSFVETSNHSQEQKNHTSIENSCYTVPEKTETLGNNPETSKKESGKE